MPTVSIDRRRDFIEFWGVFGAMQDSLAAAFVTRLLPMAADAFIQCRVTPEIKALVRTLAQRDQITESSLVKQLLEVVLRSSIAAGMTEIEVQRKAPRDMRLYVRLDPNDRLLLNERAAARGMPSATYVAVLVRSHLRHLTPLPRQELLALKTAVAELGAIGRNLNQIARAMNQGQRVAGPGREELRAMLQVGGALRDHVKSLLAGNAKSWDQGHAEAAH
jgi:Bacterial mobilisation protein (MobC)